MRLNYERTFANQQNPWGRQEGSDPQRTDLWQVWFTEVIKNLRRQALTDSVYSSLDDIFPYEVQSVQLPELKVKAEPVRKDSRPYYIPSWDEPLDAIKMTFVLNSASLKYSLLAIFDAWRAIVRAGRGAFSNERSYTLNSDYRIDYAFDISVHLLRGGRLVPASSNNGQSTVPTQRLRAGLPELDVTPFDSPQPLGAASSDNKKDFEIARTLTLKDCWLAGYRVGELSYTDSKVLTIDATFYADDISSRGKESAIEQLSPYVYAPPRKLSDSYDNTKVSSSGRVASPSPAPSPDPLPPFPSLLPLPLLTPQAFKDESFRKTGRSTNDNQFVIDPETGLPFVFP